MELVAVDRIVVVVIGVVVAAGGCASSSGAPTYLQTIKAQLPASNAIKLVQSVC
ncbi:MAG TPA: hypothetical protein VF393_02280 [archaeon]